MNFLELKPIRCLIVKLKFQIRWENCKNVNNYQGSVPLALEIQRFSYEGVISVNVLTYYVCVKTAELVSSYC